MGGEKTSVLTNMIIALVAFAVLVIFVDNAFPEITNNIKEAMNGVISNFTNGIKDISPSVGFMKFLG